MDYGLLIKGDKTPVYYQTHIICVFLINTKNERLENYAQITKADIVCITK
jgi:hypothetical protein